MIEETGAEASLFALYTLDGHQYTTEMLLLYAIELGLQYTLLLTLNGYIGLV